MKKHTPSRYVHLALPDDTGEDVRLLDKKTGATILVKKAYPNMGNEPISSAGVHDLPDEQHLVLEFQTPLESWSTAHLTTVFLNLWQELRKEKVTQLADAPMLKKLGQEYVSALRRGDNLKATAALRKWRSVGQNPDRFRKRKTRIVDNSSRNKMALIEYKRLRKMFPYESHRTLCQEVQKILVKEHHNIGSRTLEKIISQSLKSNR